MADVKYKIEIDGNGAVTSVEKLTDAEKELDKQTENLNDSLKSTGQGFSAFEKGVVVLNQGIGLATTAFNVIKGAATTFFDTVSRGSEVDDISSAFASLTEKAGGTADVFANQLDDAFGGTITKFDQMKQANELLLGGLKPDEIVDVADAARSLGEATGVSAAEGMNLLADSLLRGNDKALKTLGIVVDLEAAERKFAEAIGTTREELTEEQRVQVARQSVLEAARAKTEELGKVSNDAGDNIASLKSSFANLFDEFASGLSKNVEMNKALASLAEAVKGIDVKPVIEGLADITKFAADTITAIKELGPLLKAAFVGPGGAIADFAEKQDKAAKSAKTLVSDIVKFNNVGYVHQKVVSEMGKATGGATEAQKKFRDELGKVNDEISDLIGVNRFPELQKQIQAVIDQQASTPLNETAEALSKIAEQALKAKVPTGDLIGLIKEAKEQAPIFGPGNDAGLADFNREAVEAQEKVEGLAGALLGLDSNLGEFNLGKLLGGFENIGADLLTGFLNGDFFGEEQGKQLGGQVGQTIAESFGFSDPISQAIAKWGGEAIAGGLHDAFSGGGNADTEARKDLDKFFSELFSAENLKVIIDGELRDLSDLDFGGSDAFNQEGWASLFDELPAAAREAFLGAGLAFNTLLETGQDIGGQLAAVFTNNVGGSLNNLQILIQTTGKSMEELTGAIVTGALRGEISFLQAQSAIEGLATVMQKGIPDAVGAVVQAFQNLQDAGTKGGRVSIDALRDLASEAKELGKKTLPELEESLRSSGKFTAESIQAIMSALNQYGITTLDELENVSDQTAIAILANLEANQFPFKKTLEDIAELNQAIKDIPSNVVKNLTFNVKTNLDSNTQNFAAAGGFKSAGVPAPGPA